MSSCTVSPSSSSLFAAANDRGVVAQRVPFLIQVGASLVRKTDINDRLVRFAWWTLAIIVFALVLAIRIRLLRIPLERDEGEYAYAGQLLLQGIPPYRLAYNMKFPGTYAAYALIMAALGQNASGIHLGLAFINAVSIVLVYLIGSRLFSRASAAAAAWAYALMAMGAGVMGTQAHATHFVVAAALAGTLLLLRSIENNRAGELFLS